MIEGEASCMQPLPAEDGRRAPDGLGRLRTFLAYAAIERVAEQGPALVGEVGTDLVRPSRQKLDVEPRRCFHPRQHGEAGDRVLPLAHARGEPLPIDRVAAVE